MKTLKSFEQFISEEDFFQGGLANGMSAEDLADKHGLSVEEIKAALEKGQRVEMEHTDDADKAFEIAKDHIFEDPKYYDKLAKIEDEPANEAVTVYNDRYVRAHGKAPRGKGLWAFSYDKRGEDSFWAPNSMSYSDAVKWAQQKAKEDGKGLVFLMEDLNEAGDHEVGMAQGQLKSICDSATELMQKIGNTEKDIPGWIQDHISQSYNYIKQANDNYHELSESFQTQTDEPLANLALSLFAIRDQAHMFHWQTKAYSRHMAFGEFYDSFIDKVDELMENIMGKMSSPTLSQGTITISGYSDSTVADFIQAAKKVFEVQMPQVVPSEGNGEIYNIAEELVAQINKLSYLLTLE